MPLQLAVQPKPHGTFTREYGNMPKKQKRKKRKEGKKKEKKENGKVKMEKMNRMKRREKMSSKWRIRKLRLSRDMFTFKTGRVSSSFRRA